MTKKQREEWERAAEELDRAYRDAINAIADFIQENAKRLANEKVKQ